MAIQHHCAVVRTFECYQAFYVAEKADSRRDAREANHGPTLRKLKEAADVLSELQHGLEVYGGISSEALEPLAPATMKAAALSDLLAKRVAKDNDRLKNLQNSYESAVKESIKNGANMDTDVLERLVDDSLGGSGEQGAVLRDAQIEDSLEALANENKLLKALLKTLPLPQFPADKTLSAEARRELVSLTMDRAGIAILGCPKPSLIADENEERTKYQISPKGAEIVGRWSELAHSSS
jgi:hypothetical protein